MEKANNLPTTRSSPTTAPTAVSSATPMPTGPITYVALGDSTGVGLGARNGGYVTRLFKRLLQHRPDSKLNNFCVSGATTSDVLRYQLNRGISARPELITLGIGINDLGHQIGLEEFATNYEEILSRLRQDTNAVIVVSNIPDVSNAPAIPIAARSQSQQIITQYNERLEQIAAEHGATVFDVYTITHQEVPKHPEYFSSDGFHPSDAGYELWAQQMWPTIAKTLAIDE